MTFGASFSGVNNFGESKSRTLRSAFVSNMEGGGADMMKTKLHTEMCRDFYYSPNINTTIRSTTGVNFGVPYPQWADHSDRAV
jgi:hypothetical protein